MWDSPFKGLLLLYQLYSLDLLLRRMATGLVLPWRVSFPVRMWGQVKWGSPYLWHFDSYLKEHSSLTPFTQNILFLSNTYSQLSSPLSSCILSLSPSLGPLTAKWSFFVLLPTKFWKDEIVWADNVSYNKTSLLWCWVLSWTPRLFFFTIVEYHPLCFSPILESYFTLIFFPTGPILFLAMGEGKRCSCESCPSLCPLK